MRRKATFEDRFEALVMDAALDQLRYMQGIVNLQVRLAERRTQPGSGGNVGASSERKRAVKAAPPEQTKLDGGDK